MRLLLTLLVSFLFLESAYALNEELMAEARLIVQIRAKENLEKYNDENSPLDIYNIFLRLKQGG